MKTEKRIQEEINEINLHLKAMDEVDRDNRFVQIDMDVRRNNRNDLNQRLRTLQWVIS